MLCCMELCCYVGWNDGVVFGGIVVLGWVELLCQVGWDDGDLCMDWWHFGLTGSNLFE